MRLRSLLLKELIQFFRDPVMLLLILWLYTGEVILCSFALAMDTRNLPLAVVDQDESAASRMVVDIAQVSDAFRLAAHGRDPSAAQAWLADGTVRAVLVIPADFQRRLMTAEPQALQLLLDGSNSNVATIARGYAEDMLLRFQNRWAAQAGVRPDGAEARLRIWYNPRENNEAFVVLSMIALAGLMVGVAQPAASIVREKERGTIDQLRITPIRTGELFIAKTAPALLVGVAALLPSLLIAAAFGVPFRGSIVLLIGLTALFLLSAIALGVLIAAISRSLQQTLLLAFFGLFPLMFLSGTLVPVESMPDFLRWLSLGSPLRHYLDAILAILLKGAGPETVWPQALTLGGIGTILFAAAHTVFERQSR